jgi:hypothetical protein
MTRFDIRFRRERMTEGRIRSFMNYSSLMARHKRYYRRRTRGILLLVFILVLVLTLAIAWLGTGMKQKNGPEKPAIEKFEAPGMNSE